MLPFLLFLSFLLMITSNSNNKDIHQKAGELTYLHFMKATNDNEMRLFLIANYQDPKEFEGLSRRIICEKMRMKAIKNCTEYTHFPL